MLKHDIYYSFGRFLLLLTLLFLLLLLFRLLLSGLLGGKSIILLLDFLELSHVFEKVRAALEGDEELGLEAASGLGAGAVAISAGCARDGDGQGPNLLEGSILVPDKILRRDDASCHGIAEGVQLDGLVDLKIALSEEDVEVGILLE